MNPIDNNPGTFRANAQQVQDMEASAYDERQAMEDSMNSERFESSLASHIATVFQENVDARQTSGVEVTRTTNGG